VSNICIPVGPQHPALKEPASFMFTLEGERVIDVDLRLGYNHRGIEKACEGRNYLQCIYLIERICGICSHSHTSAFVNAVDTILGVEVPRRAQYLRTIVAELERVHSHLLWLGVAGHEVAWDSLFMYSWRDREVVQDILEMVSGNRVNYAINTVGGVRRDITPEQVDQILKAIDVLEVRTKYYQQLATSEPTFIARLAGVGRLPRQMAIDLCAVGPFARASGLPMDVRKDDPYFSYGEVPFEVITYHSEDILGRAVVRILELYESFKILRYCLRHLPDGPITVKVPRRIPAGQAVSRYEAPRGEDIHFVKANGTDKPERVKVRAPTMANLPATLETLKGGYVADIPIAIASIDPCFSCTDRVVALKDVDGRREDILTWEELRHRANRWHAENPRARR
jgi:membrane-bound hydrogenase subunit alpha